MANQNNGTHSQPNEVQSAEVIQRIKLSTYIIAEMTPQEKKNLMTKYELLATAIRNSNENSNIVNDIDNYRILLNKVAFDSAVRMAQTLELVEYPNLHSMIQTAMAKKNGKRAEAFNAVRTGLINKIKTLSGDGVGCVDSIHTDQLKSALASFGLEVATDIDNADEIDSIDATELDNGDINPVLDDVFDTIETPMDENETIPNMDDMEYSLDDLDESSDTPLVENMEDDIETVDASELNDVADDDGEFTLDDLEEEEQKKEEARKESLKQGDVSGKADDINGKIEDDPAIASVVNNVISNIMNTYSMLYQPLFTNPPKGVLYTSEKSGRPSIMSVGKAGEKEGVKVHELHSISLLMGYTYSAIMKHCSCLKEAPKVGDDGMYIKASWLQPDGTIAYNYAPHIQVRNCMGVYRDKKTGHLRRAKTWTEFSTKLSAEIKPTIFSMLKRVDVNDPDTFKRAIESIQELYTTIVLVNEFDPEKAMRLTVYSRTASTQGMTAGIAKSIVNANPLSKSIDEYEIMNDSEKAGVRQILIVTNKDKYRGEINFTYKTLGKIINSGGAIDISHAIVGTDLTGNPVELNLANNSYTSIGIVAGSRSGKGVLTMSLLASMIGAKCPVVYLDYKPDMAGAFWKLERQYGKPILAIDGQTSTLKGLTPVRNYNAGYGCPKALVDDLSDKLNVIPYIKGVQIMNLIGAARVSGKIPSSKKMFFVLDEAQQCSKAIDEAAKAITTLRDKNKPRSKQDPTPEYKYLQKLSMLYNSLGIAATTFLNTNAGSGNMSALVLGQQANAGEWRGPFQSMMLKCAVKFLGTGTVGGSQYGLNSKIPGVSMIGTGYFGLSSANTPTVDNTKIVKTSMVLNDADFNPSTMQGGAYTGALLKNITNENVKQDIIQNDMIVSESNEIALSAGLGVGQANKLVGFPGLIEYIGQNNGDFDLADALHAGYREVATVLHMLGIVGEGCPYSNVEAYMYSAKNDSLFSSGQLNNALNNGMTIYQYIENGADISEMSESGNGYVETESNDPNDIIDMYSAGDDRLVDNDDRLSETELAQVVNQIIAASGLKFKPDKLVVAKQVCIQFLRKRGW